MSISDRYRQMVDEIRSFQRTMEGSAGAEEEKELNLIARAVKELGELQETVGEIPRIRLESELTPVLLRAHGHLDRSRLLFDEKGMEDEAASVWELEQKIYRLLNDL